MIITENQLFDYIYCPVKYHMKYVANIETAEEVSVPKLLKQVTTAFYTQLLNGKVMSLESLKKRWDKICEQHKGYIDSKKAIYGWTQLINFLKWAEREQIIVADVNAFFLITTPEGNQLQGNAETVLVTPQKHIEILDTNFSEKLPDQIDIDMKLKYALNIEGFNTIYGRYPEAQKIHFVKHDTTFTTIRNEMDIKRLHATIDSICTGIEQEVFYPRESIMCKTCSCKEYCKYWHNPKKRR